MFSRRPTPVDPPPFENEEKTTLRKAIITLAATGVVFGFAVPAMAAPTAGKDLCKNGGYANYIDSAAGQPFTNQGTCVALVNHGGALVPVEAAPEYHPEILWNFFTAGPAYGENKYGISYTIQGLKPNDYVAVSYTYSGGHVETGFGYGTFPDGGIGGWAAAIGGCDDPNGLITTITATQGDLRTSVGVPPSPQCAPAGTPTA